MREVVDKAAAHRIECKGKDNWNGRRRLFDGSDTISACDDDGDVGVDELRRVCADALGVAPGPTIVDPNGLSVDPAECSQPPVESLVRPPRWG